MKVLIVASGNHGAAAPFVQEQADALRNEGCTVQLFLVRGGGAKGYLHNIRPLRAAIDSFRPNVLHAHYGLCGLLSSWQRRIPVVVTYHGSDIYDPKARFFSRVAIRRATCNIFVSSRLLRLSKASASKSILLPCGIDADFFAPMNPTDARIQMGLDREIPYILFAGAFDNLVKNATLAQAACSLLPRVQLKELKGYSRGQVRLLMNAANCLLMTSHSEGSPQVVKEALAVGLPVVSTDVGDVPELLLHTQGGVIASASSEALADSLRPYTTSLQRTGARQQLLSLGLDQRDVARRLMQIYHDILSP